ncbi:MAG: DUF5623 domain-containing protein [Nitrospirae bacterium]|jgi:hypothetical protein|nr:DUF5623 domain-containing protein [Nitrospirota bacterium]
MSERPAGRMPLTAHRNTGKWLSDMFYATLREPAFSSRIEFVRRTLHTWVREEYSETELPMTVYRSLYFGMPDSSAGNPGTGTIETLADCARLNALVQRVIDTLVENYPQGLESESLLISLDGAKLELARIRKNIEMYGDPRKK